MLIWCIPLQVLKQLNVFAEDDISAAAEALDDVRLSPEMLILYSILLPPLSGIGHYILESRIITNF
jgi:hypothetical protein